MPTTNPSYQIKDLTRLNDPSQLLGKLIEVEDLTTGENYGTGVPTLTRAVALSLPPPQKTMNLRVRTYDAADPHFNAGFPATLVSETQAKDLCLGARAQVEFPYPSKTYELQPDAAGQYQVYIDSTFSGPKIAAKWVDVTSSAYGAAGIPDFMPFATYAQGDDVKYQLGGTYRLFAATQALVPTAFAGSQVPAPTGLQGDPNWVELNGEIAPNNSRLGNLAARYYANSERDQYGGDTLEDIAKRGILYLGRPATVELGPHAGTYRVEYDGSASPAFYAYVDGSFAGGMVPAKWALVPVPVVDTTNLAKLDRANAFAGPLTVNNSSGSEAATLDAAELRLTQQGNGRAVGTVTRTNSLTFSFLDDSDPDNPNGQTASVVMQNTGRLDVQASEVTVPEPVNGNNPATMHYVDQKVAAAGSKVDDTKLVHLSGTEVITGQKTVTSEFVSDNEGNGPRGITINQYSDNPASAATRFNKARGSKASPADAQPGDLISYQLASARLNGTYTNDRAGIGSFLGNNGGIGFAFMTGNQDANYRPTLRADENGNVSIGDFGTIIPYNLQAVSDRLTVNGSVRATKFVGDGSQLTGLPASVTVVPNLSSNSATSVPSVAAVVAPVTALQATAPTADQKAAFPPLASAANPLALAANAAVAGLGLQKVGRSLGLATDVSKVYLGAGFPHTVLDPGTGLTNTLTDPASPQYAAVCSDYLPVIGGVSISILPSAGTFAYYDRNQAYIASPPAYPATPAGAAYVRVQADKQSNYDQLYYTQGRLPYVRAFNTSGGVVYPDATGVVDGTKLGSFTATTSGDGTKYLNDKGGYAVPPGLSAATAYPFMVWDSGSSAMKGYAALTQDLANQLFVVNTTSYLVPADVTLTYASALGQQTNLAMNTTRVVTLNAGGVLERINLISLSAGKTNVVVTEASANDPAKGMVLRNGTYNGTLQLGTGRTDGSVAVVVLDNYRVTGVAGTGYVYLVGTGAVTGTVATGVTVVTVGGGAAYTAGKNIAISGANVISYQPTVDTTSCTVTCGDQRNNTTRPLTSTSEMSNAVDFDKVVSDPGNNFDFANHCYVVPVTGRYFIATRVRFRDGLAAGYSYTTYPEVPGGDAAQALFSSTTPARSAQLNIWQPHLTAGQHVYLTMYLENFSSEVSGQMEIRLLTAD